MDRVLLDRQLDAARLAHANGIGCGVSAFAADDLTIVDRPEPPVWPYLAQAVTFGTGTVLSVDADYHSIAEEHRPEHHWRALYPAFMQQLVDEARRRGRQATSGGVGLGYVLGVPPVVPEPPPRLELREVDAAWMNARQASGRFENGVGEGEADGRTGRNQFGLALVDESGEPVAVAGVFHTFGLSEIGVDVLREHRGRGFGKLVVAAAARAVLERDTTPVYFCSATNVRSQRTALSCGFVPACTVASVS